MAVVVVDRDDPGVVDRLVDAERAGTVVTGRRLVADRLVELVVVVVLVFQFRDPLGPGPVEDELEVVIGVLGELLGCLEAVDEPTGVAVGFGPCQNYGESRRKPRSLGRG